MMSIVDVAQELILLATDTLYSSHDPWDSSVPLHGERPVSLMMQVELIIVLEMYQFVTIPGVTEQVHITLVPDDIG